MQPPAQTDPHSASPDPGIPPYVPIRHVRWPTRRTPRWFFAAGAGFAVGDKACPKAAADPASMTDQAPMQQRKR